MRRNQRRWSSPEHGRRFCPGPAKCPPFSERIGVKLSLATRHSTPRGRKYRNTTHRGDLTMQKRSFLLLSLLVPAFLGLGGYAIAQGQQKGSPAAGARRWSDAATWPDKKVPDK